MKRSVFICVNTTCPTGVEPWEPGTTPSRDLFQTEIEKEAMRHWSHDPICLLCIRIHMTQLHISLREEDLPSGFALRGAHSIYLEGG